MAHLLAGAAPRKPCVWSTGLRNARPGRTPRTRTRVAAGRRSGVAAHDGRAAAEPAGFTARGALPAPLRALPGAGGQSSGEGRGSFRVGDAGSPRSLVSPTTRVRCLLRGGGRRPPAYLPLRLRVTPRLGLEGSIRRHPASTLGKVRRGTVIRCHPLSLQVAVSHVYSDNTQRLCLHSRKDFLL